MSNYKCNSCENYKEKEKPCLTCARSPEGKQIPRSETGCSGFIQRNCGNCGWHGEHKEGFAANCFCGMFKYLKFIDRHKATDVCRWKPIPDKEPACDKCGGNGEIEQEIFKAIYVMEERNLADASIISSLLTGNKRYKKKIKEAVVIMEKVIPMLCNMCRQPDHKSVRLMNEYIKEYRAHNFVQQ